MRAPIWVQALSATMVAQVISSFAAATIPLLGTVLAQRWGLEPAAIGYASAAMSTGVCWCLACGTPMLNHHGSIRTLQIGLGFVMLGIVGIAQSSFVIGLVGAFLLGVGLAPNNPAGSSLLMSTAPVERRNLIFSIRQAGVPVGGALAGVMMAPMLGSVGFGPSIIAVLGLLALAIVALQPFRRQLDTDRKPQQSWALAFLSPGTLFRSLPVLRSHRDLPLLTMIGVSLSIAQSCVLAFIAAFLLVEAGKDLAEAGRSMAILLLASATARIAFGWIADRYRCGYLLLCLLLLAAALAVGLLLVIANGPQWLLIGAVALVGATSLGWTGLYMAELARLAPAPLVGEVTSVANLFGFAGSVAGPLIFSIATTATNSFIIGFVFVAIQLSACGLFALSKYSLFHPQRRLVVRPR